MASPQSQSVLERSVENIILDLFTEVLDWQISDLQLQLENADIVVKNKGISCLIIEAKKPGLLLKSPTSVIKALAQARGYADKQRVQRIAVCDGMMLYAVDIENGGLKDRAYINLAEKTPPEILWWLSVHGIYRTHDDDSNIAQRRLPYSPNNLGISANDEAEDLLHKKYKIPARCFAYVEDASDPKNWKLPYRLMDGSIDAGRLPGAIRAVITNYRGARLKTVPDIAIPDVLVRLALGARSLGCLPYQGGKPKQTYQDLETVLIQLGRLDEVKSAP